MKLIDAAQAAEALNKELGIPFTVLCDTLGTVPRADAGLIRCRECAHGREACGEDGTIICGLLNFLMWPNDYCSYGERRGDGKG